MTGRHRRWHASHVLMAAGMVVMFLPTNGMLIPAAAGVWVFALAAGLLALALFIARLRGAALGPLWAANVVDLAAMAYMFAMMSTRLAWVSVPAAAWFAVQALGWATGWLGRVLERGGLGETAPPTHHAAATTTVAGQEPDPSPTAEVHEISTQEQGGEQTGAPVGVMTITAAVTSRVAAIQRRVVDGGHQDWSVRLTLSVMAAGMAYMLLAMQFGMSPMPNMTGGMPGMGGM